MVERQFNLFVHGRNLSIQSILRKARRPDTGAYVLLALIKKSICITFIKWAIFLIIQDAVVIFRHRFLRSQSRPLCTPAPVFVIPIAAFPFKTDA